MNSQESTYNRLIAPIEEQMIKSIWRIVQNRHDAEDCMQNALTVIWKKLGRIKRHNNPHALILRICINCAYDTLRKNLRSRRQEELDTITERIAATSPLPDANIQAEERRKAIMYAISKLPKKMSNAVLMRFIHDMAYSEIAAALGCREATARKHVERGRNLLTKQLASIKSN